MPSSFQSKSETPFQSKPGASSFQSEVTVNNVRGWGTQRWGNSVWGGSPGESLVNWQNSIATSEFQTKSTTPFQEPK